MEASAALARCGIPRFLMLYLQQFMCNDGLAMISGNSCHIIASLHMCYHMKLYEILLRLATCVQGLRNRPFVNYGEEEGVLENGRGGGV